MRTERNTNRTYKAIETIGNWLMAVAMFVSLNLIFFYQPAQGCFVLPLANRVSVESVAENGIDTDFAVIEVEINDKF
jgi:hypothetical protein